MKPFQIGLLVLVGALGGALIMKFTQRPKPVPAPVPPPPPQAVSRPPPRRSPQRPPSRSPPLPKTAAPAAPSPCATRSRLVQTPPVTVAQNLPPAQPQQPVAQPRSGARAEPAEPAAPVEPAAAPAAASTAEAVAPPPAPQPPPSVTLQSGMTLPVRSGREPFERSQSSGRHFYGTLDAPLSAGGFVIAEKGARVEGRVVEAQKSGAKGKATLALELTKLSTSDGQHVEIKTETLRKQSERWPREIKWES